MPQRTPLIFLINWGACIKCGACVAVCPQPYGFATPFDTIAENTPCDIVCMACEEVCPVSAIEHRAAHRSNATEGIGYRV